MRSYTSDQYRTKWNSDEKSANPHPVCRRGHYPKPAAEGSEWCEEHGAQIAAAQERAQVERAAMKRDGSLRYRPQDVA